MDTLEKSVELRDKLYKISDILDTAIHALQHINVTESDCVITVLESALPYISECEDMADAMERAE